MTSATALSKAVRPFPRSVRPFWLILGLPLVIACGLSDDDDSGAGGSTGGGTSVSGGNGFATGGFVTSTGGIFGTSGSSTSTGGKISSSGGLAATGGVPSSGGTGKAGTSAGGSSTTSQAGIGGIPGPGPDGKSPYQRECHGETSMCVDVASLRCLGIRVDTGVAGYSCSNPCQTDADCSKVLSSAEAAPGCVDFVTQKHCLLVCQQAGKSFSCPTGMGCYVYPGTTIGYCLWQ